MTEINSYKPLERAILAGEKEVKISTPKFLLACAVAEKCHANPSYTNRPVYSEPVSGENYGKITPPDGQEYYVEALFYNVRCS
ncbi:MAG: hypothetical protein IKH88_09495 [Prevotella sp.]|nr:hypothetical protein [Prevotella sp.]